eukprot:scaffold2069_cov254-Pinguiococcus_pyrenoidosus.AAC.16
MAEAEGSGQISTEVIPGNSCGLSVLPFLRGGYSQSAATKPSEAEALSNPRLLRLREAETPSISPYHGSIEPSAHAGGAPTPQSREARVTMSDADEFVVKVKTTQAPVAKELRLRRTQTVLEAKKAVAQLLNAGDKYVRLIASGRMLAPDAALVEQFCPPLQDGAFVHAVVTAKPNPGRLRASLLRPTPAGATEDDDEVDPTSLHGFDRLRSSGFGRAEVLALRSYFRRHLRCVSVTEGHAEGRGVSGRAAL